MSSSQIDPTTSTAVDVGEDVVEAIARAARGAPAGAMVVASGEVEDVELLTLQRTKEGSSRVRRVLQGPSDLVSLVGVVNVASDGGRTELRAMLAREGDAGATVVGGVLVRALSVSVRFAFTSASASASAPAPIPLPASATPRAEAPPPVSPQVLQQPEVTAIPPPTPTPQPRPMPAPGVEMAAALPPKIQRRNAQPDEFPEENDVVTHFLFGRCIVLTSDGERLRLQQEKDSRVREVALSMLRIDAPTVLEDGRKHWELSRKN